MNRLLVFVFAAVAAAGIATHARAVEQILDYEAQIEIAHDGSLTVTESITVNAEGKKIKRGIYRDFPTHYRGRFGQRVVVPFEVVSVKRDGGSEDSHLKKVDGGIRVYFGNAKRQVSEGVHRYEIVYQTGWQVGFFEEHDELYWNVTGNFWEFPILRARATVRLPETVDSANVAHEGYTGAAGSKGRGLSSAFDAVAREFYFETTNALPERHGLTIVAQFPKGIVTPPSEAERREAFLCANASLIAGLVGAMVLLGYYWIAWIAMGRDPAAGTIIPLFEAPRGQSPGAMRHLMQMGYDNTCFSAALVNMAVKGFLRIEETGGVYTLVRADADRKVLSSGEKRIAANLLGSGRFEIRRAEHAKIRKTIAAFKKWLKLENEGGLFRANRAAIIPGIAISVLAIGAIGYAMKDEILGNPSEMSSVFLTIWLTFWSVGVYGLLVKVVIAWKDVRKAESGISRVGTVAAAIFISCFAIPFVGAEIFVLGLLVQSTSLALVATLLVLALSNVVFYQLMRRPTKAGRRLMDEIEGFKMYLCTAESDDIRRLEGPKRTPELFEKFLPYALALGVENEWAERFSDVLEQAGMGEDGGYRPVWYSGGSFDRFGSEGLVSSLGSSLSGAIASNSSAPGSSSGGGGGGSSGGGGGGGGGGGW
ncbi:MAG: DUF2207 domain-containing protein [Deltaproteobacteria bacterium]|nr:DUF2207 domain-containing protein [Deltaproteobacteria bacterium]